MRREKKLAWAAAPCTSVTPASPLVENVGACSRCANPTTGGGARTYFSPRSGRVSPKPSYKLTKSFLERSK